MRFETESGKKMVRGSDILM